MSDELCKALLEYEKDWFEVPGKEFKVPNISSPCLSVVFIIQKDMFDDMELMPHPTSLLDDSVLLEMLSKPSIPLVESFAALGLMVEEQEDFLNTMGDFSVQPYLSYSLKDNGPVVPCFSQSPVDFFVPVPLRMSCRNINDSEPPTSARFSILIGQPSDRVNFEGEYSCSFCKMDCFTSEAFLLHLTGCVRDVIRTESKCTGPAINLKTKKDED